MKLYDGGKIIIGLAVFLAFVLFPFYYNIGQVNTKPELKTDTRRSKSGKRRTGKRSALNQRNS